jgi:hypothetical protein
LEKFTSTGGWVSIDPVNDAIVEAVYKKIMGGRRKAHAVLKTAVEDFQKYVLARRPRRGRISLGRPITGPISFSA